MLHDKTQVIVLDMKMANYIKVEQSAIISQGVKNERREFIHYYS